MFLGIFQARVLEWGAIAFSKIASIQHVGLPGPDIQPVSRQEDSLQLSHNPMERSMFEELSILPVAKKGFCKSHLSEPS